MVRNGDKEKLNYHKKPQQPFLAVFFIALPFTSYLFDIWM